MTENHVSSYLNQDHEVKGRIQHPMLLMPNYLHVNLTKKLIDYASEVDNMPIYDAFLVSLGRRLSAAIMPDKLIVLSRLLYCDPHILVKYIAGEYDVREYKYLPSKRATQFAWDWFNCEPLLPSRFVFTLDMGE